MTLTYRVGIGTDFHRLAEPGPLILANVAIPFEKHAVGHSDADVLLHSLIDALLGAASRGDIGQLFPDTDEGNRGRNSAEMLDAVWENMQKDGWQLENVDCVIHLQRPKLAPHIERMRQRMAELLGCLSDRVSIKAKTGEGVGVVGREEAVTAECVVLLSRPTP